MTQVWCSPLWDSLWSPRLIDLVCADSRPYVLSCSAGTFSRSPIVPEGQRSALWFQSISERPASHVPAPLRRSLRCSSDSGWIAETWTHVSVVSAEAMMLDVFKDLKAGSLANFTSWCVACMKTLFNCFCSRGLQSAWCRLCQNPQVQHTQVGRGGWPHKDVTIVCSLHKIEETTLISSHLRLLSSCYKSINQQRQVAGFPFGAESHLDYHLTHTLQILMFLITLSTGSPYGWYIYRPWGPSIICKSRLIKKFCPALMKLN